MDYEGLRLIRNSLYRAFVIGLIIVFVQWAVMLPFWDLCAETGARMFRVLPEIFLMCVLWYFTAAKFFLMFVFLIPALGIHWTLNREKACCHHPERESRA